MEWTMTQGQDLDLRNRLAQTVEALLQAFGVPVPGNLSEMESYDVRCLDRQDQREWTWLGRREVLGERQELRLWGSWFDVNRSAVLLSYHFGWQDADANLVQVDSSRPDPSGTQWHVSWNDHDLSVATRGRGLYISDNPPYCLGWALTGSPLSTPQDVEELARMDAALDRFMREYHAPVMQVGVQA